MKKSLFIGVTLLFLLGACQEDFSHRLARETREYSDTHCPLMVGPDVRLDSMRYDMSSDVLTRYFSWLGVTDPQALSDHLHTSSDSVRAALRKELLQDMGWKTCVDHGVTFRYEYRDAVTQKALYSTEITPNRK